MSNCPTKCPDFKKYIDILRTIPCPQAREYIDQLATSPAFANGVKLYSDGHEVYTGFRGSPYTLLNKLMKKEIEDGDKAKWLLGYSLRRIAETGECGLSDTMLSAAQETGMFENEIELQLLEKIRRHSSQISSLLNK